MPEITPAILAAADQVDSDLDALDMSTRTLLSLLRAGDTQPPSGGGGGGSNIEYLGSDAVVGTGSTLTVPTHAAGDILIAIGYRDGSPTRPTNPSSPWVTPISSITGGAGTSQSYKVSYVVATDGATPAPSFANATMAAIVAYRGATGPLDGALEVSIEAINSTVIDWPSLTLDVTDGSSFVLAMLGHCSGDVDLSIPVSGLTTRAHAASTGSAIAVYDTAAGVASFSGGTVDVGGTARNWLGLLVEVVSS